MPTPSSVMLTATLSGPRRKGGQRHGDVDLAAVVHGVQGVVDDVQKDLLELPLRSLSMAECLGGW